MENIKTVNLKCAKCGHTWVVHASIQTKIDTWQKCPNCAKYSDCTVVDNSGSNNFFTKYKKK